MNAIDRPSRLLAVGLSALAGYIDAVGFLHLGGFFVSFMSGNSTRLGVGLSGAAPDALLAGMLIAAFVLGVVAGSLLGHRAGRRRKGVVLALVAALLAAAAALGPDGRPGAPLSWATLVATLAMGAANTVFERDGDIPFGVTYMTGALVKVGQRLALALHGGPPLGWLLHAALWLGLVAGAAGGSLAYARFGLGALWPASAVAFAFAGLIEVAGLLARRPAAVTGRA